VSREVSTLRNEVHVARSSGIHSAYPRHPLNQMNFETDLWCMNRTARGPDGGGEVIAASNGLSAQTAKLASSETLRLGSAAK
jgi:hypothetical protein